jgi:hypothetical protein
MIRMNNNRRHTMDNVRARVKVIAAVGAAGAVVTMGALTAALSGTEAPEVRAASGGAGDTSTQAPPPPTPSIEKAEPGVKSPKWKVGIWQ